MSIRMSARSSRLVGAVLASGAVAVAGMTLASPAQAAAARCADVNVVIARGTGEPGTYGAVVGDAVSSKITKRLAGRKTVTSYAVNYPADSSYGSADLGRADLVAHVKAQARACPQQVFVLSGYSQGATVVDTALGVTYGGWLYAQPDKIIPTALAPRVKAILLFGNPFRLTGGSVAGAYAPRVFDICRTGDPACQPGGTDVLTHARYGENTDAAVTFALHRL